MEKTDVYGNPVTTSSGDRVYTTPTGDVTQGSYGPTPTNPKSDE